MDRVMEKFVKLDRNDMRRIVGILWQIADYQQIKSSRTAN